MEKANNLNQNQKLIQLVYLDPKRGNDKCFDCSSKKVSWASLYHGIVLCLDCALNHKTNLNNNEYKIKSVIKSIDMPYWNDEENRIMIIGGNKNLKNFLLSYEIESLAYCPEDHLKKYNLNCINYYRKFLLAEAQGKPLKEKRPNLIEGKKLINLDNLENINIQKSSVDINYIGNLEFNENSNKSEQIKTNNNNRNENFYTERTQNKESSNLDDDIIVESVYLDNDKNNNSKINQPKDIQENIINPNNSDFYTQSYNHSKSIKNNTKKTTIKEECLSEEKIMEDLTEIYYEGIDLMSDIKNEINNEFEKRGYKEKVNKHKDYMIEGSKSIFNSIKCFFGSDSAERESGYNHNNDNSNYSNNENNLNGGKQEETTSNKNTINYYNNDNNNQNEHSNKNAHYAKIDYYVDISNIEKDNVNKNIKKEDYHKKTNDKNVLTDYLDLND